MTNSERYEALARARVALEEIEHAATWSRQAGRPFANGKLDCAAEMAGFAVTKVLVVASEMCGSRQARAVLDGAEVPA